MQPISLTVPLSGGSVTLRAWGAHVTDALLLDLMRVSGTLAQLHDGGWEDVQPPEIEQGIWEAYSRLLSHSLDGTALPEGTTLLERLHLLDAMWALNDVPEVESKLTGLSERVRTLQARMQAQPSP